jgi:hypothetical protein
VDLEMAPDPNRMLPVSETSRPISLVADKPIVDGELIIIEFFLELKISLSEFKII